MGEEMGERNFDSIARFDALTSRLRAGGRAGRGRSHTTTAQWRRDQCDLSKKEWLNNHRSSYATNALAFYPGKTAAGRPVVPYENKEWKIILLLSSMMHT